MFERILGARRGASCCGRAKLAIFLLAFAGTVIAGPSALGQSGTINLPPGWRQVPQGTGACVVGKSCAELAPAMVKNALGASPLEENLRYLTDTVGGRVTGSTDADRAVSWAVEALRHAGVDEVHTEEFMVPVGWSEGHTHVDVLSPAPFLVRLVSTGWSPPTPEGGITSDVVDVGSGDEAGFAKAGSGANGAIIIVHTKILATWQDLADEYRIDPPIIDRAKKAGAAAIFWMATRPNLLLYRHTSALDGQVAPIPQAIVAREDAERIARFLASGQKVRVHFDMPNRVSSGPVKAENVVAEIRGRDNPDEFVLLGAHLDSWDLGTGALDDGCNVAMLIDAARVIHSSGSVPRRSIRFVLFTGEEQGMLGSRAYVDAHAADLDNMDAAVIFDAGDGPITGFSLGGRKDALAAVRTALDPTRALGVKDFTLDAGVDTDNFDFLLEGVPTLVANQEPANYILNYHAASDTFDKVDIAQLKRNAGIAAVTAYALADAETKVGPRQTRPEIEQLMKDTRLGEDMKVEGFWPAWENGERGRQP
ncbi:MAG TPA: M20/M25/M40 family metallo-hydrolase [Candidatus Acidoferrales bacterium]|nr:M20/M25/M40 family metallo-hydrolase [Candidatus Acidoferrales bacterium]